MSRPKKTKFRSTGGRRMKELGHIASQLWYTPEDYELVLTASILDRRPMTTFAILAATEAARQLIASKGGRVEFAGSKEVPRG